MKERNKYLLMACIIFLSECAALYVFEKGENPELDSFPEAMWWIIVLLSSGFQIQPQTLGGKIVGTLLVIEGLVVLGFVFAEFAALLVKRSLSGGKIMKRVKFKDHIIVCGWTSETPRILDELTSKDVKTKRKIVVLADLEQNPLEREEITFVKGDPTRDEDLIRAGIMTADTAIILLDQKSDNPDAETILTALAVESLNRSVYTCAELWDPENEKHLIHAQVNEIVCLGRLSQNLMVHSSLKHGLSRLFSELITHNVGHEFYKMQVPSRLLGERFPRAMKRLLDEEGVILTAVERARNQKRDAETDIIVNPGHDFVLGEGDSLFVIAKEEPKPQ